MSCKKQEIIVGAKMVTFLINSIILTLSFGENVSPNFIVLVKMGLTKINQVKNQVVVYAIFLSMI